MCGIAGFLGNSHQSETLTELCVRMTTVLRHRGPDDEGTFVEPSANLALGFRRLSIVDLSSAGHQPMSSTSRRYTIVFNGEIYNFEELRSELEAERRGQRYRGHSDTEVLLAAFDQWGIQQSLPRLDGMFAIAVWDREEKALFLSRDRFGEKPLYYGRSNGTFLFASELKSLRAHPAFHGAIDRQALSAYARYNYIPTPLSIYKDIYKLAPGTSVRI